MFASDMCETIDDPCGLVVTSVCEGSTVRILALWWEKLQVRAVYKGEDVLPPGYQILPGRNVVPDVWKSIAPSPE